MSTAEMPSVGSAVSWEEITEIRQFLYREARLLDERHYEEWLTLLAEDMQYWIPVRSTPARERQDSLTVECELSGKDELGLLCNDKPALMARVMRLQGGRSFSEMPPSRVQRLIGNIEVEYTGELDLYRVYSVIIANRTRLETEAHTLVGRRSDLLQRSAGSFLLRERKIVLNSTVLNSPNLSMLL